MSKNGKRICALAFLGLMIPIWMSFNTLPSFNTESVTVLSSQELPENYMVYLEKPDGSEAIGYLAKSDNEPLRQTTLEMITSDGSTYFDKVDDLVYVDNILNKNPGVVTLWLTHRYAINALKLLGLVSAIYIGGKIICESMRRSH